MALVALGYSNAAIGDRLGVVEDTVKTHLRRLLFNFGARNRTHLVVSAQVHGVLVIECDNTAGHVVMVATVFQRDDGTSAVRISPVGAGRA